ncbi:MAG: 1-acyl-sn-glycerol-3-phosphate acyltransferase [Cyanobacteria bacterium]|nr:1-acyl-sn-glycerol-3-phosphate acyltransferase [Cyanobacteriota bacterium]
MKTFSLENILNTWIQQWVVPSILKPLLFLYLKGWYGLTIEGADTLQSLQGPIILVGNHSSFLDAPLVLVAYPKPVNFVVASEVLEWPFLGKILPWLGVFQVGNGKTRGQMKKAIDSVKQGNPLCIFPEGKLCIDGSMTVFQPGVAFIQRHTQATLVPFAIQGGFEAWGWGQKLPKRNPLILKFGTPIRYSEASVSKGSGSKEADQDEKIIRTLFQSVSNLKESIS